MSLSRRQQHQLHRIEAGLQRSDPGLGAVLDVFGTLCAGEGMPTWEQVRSRQDRIRQAAALTVTAITVAAAAIIVLLRAVLFPLTALVHHFRAWPSAPKREQPRPRWGAGDRQDPASRS